MELSEKQRARIDIHFGRPCDVIDKSIVHAGTDYRVGYIAGGEHSGWLVDVRGDDDMIVTDLTEDLTDWVEGVALIIDLKELLRVYVSGEDHHETRGQALATIRQAQRWLGN